jgi:outer membrane protein insertion porin family
LGGRRKIVGNLEAFYPIIKGEKAVRGSVFLDAGEIYANGQQSQFESFRYSTGIGVAWSSPIGPLKFSYAIPLNAREGDRQQRFQFQAGAAF